MAPQALPVTAPAIYSSTELVAAGFGDLCSVYAPGCPAASSSSGDEIQLTGPLAAAPAVGRVRPSAFKSLGKAVSGLAGTPSVPTSTRPPNAEPVIGARTELYDVEITTKIEVVDLDRAASEARALCRRYDAQIVGDVAEDELGQEGVSLSVRAPAAKAEELVKGLSALGRVLSRTTKAEDVSRKLFDAQVLLDNLQSTLQRYQTLLAQAKDVAQMTALEGELARVRTAIDRVKGDLNWLRDRVNRSTLYVTLAPHRSRRVEEETKVHPGLRAPLLVDLPARTSAARTDAYAGGGLSVLLARPLNADIDLLTAVDSSARHGVDLLLVSIGSELYSSYLGGGERRYFNPYFGFRAGYGNRGGDSHALLGGSVGLELVKTNVISTEVAVRSFAMIGDTRGTRIGIEPSLGVNFAY